MTDIGTFPFGQLVQVVEQQDQSIKQVFVLGVYASAVHARWLGPNEKIKVQALAVASEPEIFWQGDGVEEILNTIELPEGAGKLVPASTRFNGPSGIALDEFILAPLGLSRKIAWLCDLVPHSCMNSGQKKAIQRAYLPLVDKFDLPVPTVPPVPRELANSDRRNQIQSELIDSRAKYLVLLGDQPIRWFLSKFDARWKKLADFGNTVETYGRLHTSQIGGQAIQVLPLAHPRQVAKLGRSSPRWYELHQQWINHTARTLPLA